MDRERNIVAVTTAIALGEGLAAARGGAYNLLMFTPKRFSTMLACGWLSLMGCGCSNERKANDEPIIGLEVGASIPALNGIDQYGNVQHLGPGDGNPLLVYFYPKDGTPGCTKEACAFRDVWQRFERQKVRLVGVSRDDQASHEKFAREHKIPFTLIADGDAKWAKAFGVRTTFGKFNRVSFLFDKSGKLARIYRSVDPGVHATEVLSDIASLH